ncbi:histidine kinase [hydrothermal vent metagenome]|uniref:Histidine kinase n=1 Tax=hydrothermal vent metagenome TaxID=652676 RepID=A0A1W1D4J4_9ZZZZ
MLNNILVVEDSKTLNKVITNELKKHYTDVHQAFTLQEALNHIEKKKYDLVILDLHLPDGEGLELIYEIRSLTKTKVIVLTSSNDDDLREELFKFGILDYIIKDANILYSISEILKVLHHINEKKQDKILIIDDSKFICKRVKSILEPRNYKIKMAHNAENGLEKITEEKFHLIILDMELPDIHGSKVLQLIRAKKVFTPILVLSGKTDPEMVRTFLKNGANDYLKKPFIYEEFILKVDLWIDYHKKEHSLQKTQAELKKINHDLEQKVIQKVEKIRKKDEIVALKMRQAQMGEMLSMIAHQWRQPLNTMGISLTMLHLRAMQNTLEPEMVQDTLTQVNKHIQYMSQTIDDFKDFFKPQKEKKITNLEEIFTKAYNIIKPALQNAHIELKVDITTPQTIKTYENEVIQVILNILNNAIDALHEKKIKSPMILLKIKSNLLSIEDNAGGIKENIISKIFDPYFSTKSKNGTGLGLYMSKTIIQKHCCGELRVKNGHHGAKFTILLPTKKPEI